MRWRPITAREMYPEQHAAMTARLLDIGRGLAELQIRTLIIPVLARWPLVPAAMEGAVPLAQDRLFRSRPDATAT
jgi:hypothetical protein